MRRLSLSRWWGIVLKEFLQLRRDRITFGMVIGVPIVQLVLFGFIYPSERHRIPPRVMSDLLGRLERELDGPPSEERVCRGTLMSRAQYLLDIGRYGYEDARLTPRGNMSPEDAVYWTWAIENVH